MTITVVPKKPWAKSSGDRVRDIAFVLISIMSSYVVVAATPMKGKLALSLIHI